MRLRAIGLAFGAALAASAAGAGEASRVTGVTDAAGQFYNYVPTTMQTGNKLQMWWCGSGPAGDNVFYEEMDVATGTQGPIAAALKPTPGTWDALHVCDPSVVRGRWTYGGRAYGYLMYYTATDDPTNEGATNGIGVAFSNDGRSWTKYPTPIYRDPPTTPPSYGIGQQSVFSADGGAAVWVLINKVDPAGSRWTVYHSPDGLHLEARHVVSAKGLPKGFIGQADFAYDYATGQLYMASDRADTVGTIDLYRIPFCRIADASWEKIGEIGPATTGQPWNRGPGLLRNEFGNITPFLPNVVTYFSGGPKTINNQTSIWQSAVQVAPGPKVCP